MIQPQFAQQAYPAMPQAGASAVSINIIEPKAYGSQPQPQAINNPIYNYPQAQLYGAQNGAPYQTYMAPQLQYSVPPYQTYMTPQMQYRAPYQTYMAPQLQYGAPYAQYTLPQDPYMTQNPYSSQPVSYSPMGQPIYSPQQQTASRPMPEPVLQQNAEIQTPQQPQVESTAPAQQTAPAAEAAAAQQPAQTEAMPNPDELAAQLQSQDLNVQSGAIAKIAKETQLGPERALRVVTDPIMQNLVAIMQKNTADLPGPTQQQQQLLDKAVNGQQLTKEEQAVVLNLSPKDLADKNKCTSAFTLAMLNKLQREVIDEYIKEQTASGQPPMPPMQLEQLPGYNEIINAIKDPNGNDVLKVAGIQSLVHMAKPDEKAKVEAILKEAQNDKSAMVKEAAQQAMAKFAQAPEAPAPQAAPTQPAAQETAQNNTIVQIPQQQEAQPAQAA